MDPKSSCHRIHSQERKYRSNMSEHTWANWTQLAWRHGYGDVVEGLQQDKAPGQFLPSFLSLPPGAAREHNEEFRWRTNSPEAQPPTWQSWITAKKMNVFNSLPSFYFYMPKYFCSWWLSSVLVLMLIYLSLPCTVQASTRRMNATSSEIV